MPKEAGNHSDADTSENILQLQHGPDVGRPQQLQNGGFFTLRQDHRADMCLGCNSEEQQSKTSLSSNTHETAERLFSFQNLNVLHGSMNDSRQGPPDPPVRNFPRESRHNPVPPEQLVHCSRPVVTLKASERNEAQVPTSNRFTSSLSANVSHSLSGSPLRRRPATGQENNHMLINVLGAPKGVRWRGWLLWIAVAVSSFALINSSSSGLARKGRGRWSAESEYRLNLLPCAKRKRVTHQPFIPLEAMMQCDSVWKCTLEDSRVEQWERHYKGRNFQEKKYLWQVKCTSGSPALFIY